MIQIRKTIVSSLHKASISTYAVIPGVTILPKRSFPTLYEPHLHFTRDTDSIDGIDMSLDVLASHWLLRHLPEARSENVARVLRLPSTATRVDSLRTLVPVCLR